MATSLRSFLALLKSCIPFFKGLLAYFGFIFLPLQKTQEQRRENAGLPDLAVFDPKEYLPSYRYKIRSFLPVQWIIILYVHLLINLVLTQNLYSIFVPDIAQPAPHRRCADEIAPSLEYSS